MAADVQWYKVGDPYTTIQAAVNAALAAAPPGGVVYIPRGEWPLSLKITLPASNPGVELTLRGDGPNATIVKTIQPGTDLLEVQRSRVRIEGIAFMGPFENHGGYGRGIIVGGGVEDVVIRDCLVRWTGSYALLFPSPSLSPTRRVLVERSVLARPDVNGPGLVYIGSGIKEVEFRDCIIDYYGNSTAVELNGCEDIAFYNTAIEPSNGGGAFIVANNAVSCRVIDDWLEEPAVASVINWMIDLGPGCRGWTILGNYFVRQATTDGTLKIMRIGDLASAATGVIAASPRVRVTNGVTPTPGDVHIRNASTEACLFDGFYDLGASILPMTVLDDSDRSIWMMPRSSRPPRVDDSEPAPRRLRIPVLD